MKQRPSVPNLTPLLVVQDAPSALDFYSRAFGAEGVQRYVNKPLGTIAHADMALEGLRFSLTEEARDWDSHAPPSLGGTPVVLQLQVENVDAALQRAREAGAIVVFPLLEFCGERMTRLRDPFGHVWILKQQVEELTAEEIQRRRDVFVESLLAQSKAQNSSKT